mmetsp:Transcript_2411/g.5243  ORF Transcript_2411/g.5243 Transcript_2411/m.5243 type:complete len:237 (-) Transcript_2411:491-1201(-)
MRLAMLIPFSLVVEDFWKDLGMSVMLGGALPVFFLGNAEEDAATVDAAAVASAAAADGADGSTDLVPLRILPPVLNLLVDLAKDLGAEEEAPVAPLSMPPTTGPAGAVVSVFVVVAFASPPCPFIKLAMLIPSAFAVLPDNDDLANDFERLVISGALLVLGVVFSTFVLFGIEKEEEVEVVVDKDEEDGLGATGSLTKLRCSSFTGAAAFLDSATACAAATVALLPLPLPLLLPNP